MLGVATSVINVVVSERFLFVKVSVVDLPTSVSVTVGSVKVPVLEILEIIGSVRVLLVSVCTESNPARVSLAFGRVIVRFTVCEEFTIVEVVPLLKVKADIVRFPTSEIEAVLV